jgi:centractin
MCSGDLNSCFSFFSQLGPERFRATEILFNPELIGEEFPGIHQVVVDSINRTDLDLRKHLFHNIILSGGTTLCKGFGDRLLFEVKKLTMKDVKVRHSYSSRLKPLETLGSRPF